MHNATLTARLNRDCARRTAPRPAMPAPAARRPATLRGSRPFVVPVRPRPRVCIAPPAVALRRIDAAEDRILGELASGTLVRSDRGRESIVHLRAYAHAAARASRLRAWEAMADQLSAAERALAMGRLSEVVRRVVDGERTTVRAVAL